MRFLRLIFLVFFSNYAFCQVQILGISTLSGCVGTQIEVPNLIFRENFSNDFRFGLISNGNASFNINAPAGFNFVNDNAALVSINENGDIQEGASISLSNNLGFYTVNLDLNNRLPKNNLFNISLGNTFSSDFINDYGMHLYESTEIDRSGTLSGISLSILKNAPTFTEKYSVRIRVKMTTVSGFPASAYYGLFNDDIDTSNSVLVFSRTIDNSFFSRTGETFFDFTNDFYYDNAYNLIIYFEKKGLSNTGGSQRALNYRTVSNKIQSLSRRETGFIQINPILSNGEFFQSSFFYKPSIRFHFNRGGVSNIDNITVSGLKLTSNSVILDQPISLFSNINFLNGIPNNYEVGNITSAYSIGLIGGLDQNYCESATLDTINFFPPNGVFQITPNVSGLISVSGTNQAILDLTKLSTVSGSFNVNYTYPDYLINGCTVTSQSFVKNEPIKIRAFSSTPLSIEFNSTIVSELSASESGSSIFSGFGVSNNKFYPNLLSSAGRNPIYLDYTNTLTGCTSKDSLEFYLYDRDESFTFIPTPVLGKGRFCSDDNIAYKMVINTIPGLISGLNISQRIQQGLSISGANCFAFHSFSNSLNPGGVYLGNGISSTGVGNENDFTFRPSDAPISSFAINYNYQLGIPQITDNCNSFDGSNFFLFTEAINSSQPVTIFEKPFKPILSVYQKEFCVGEASISNFILQASSSLTGVSYKWYIKTVSGALIEVSGLTTSGVSLANLGLSTSSSASTIPYRYCVRQIVNGCFSDTSTFSALIKPIPSRPNIVFKRGKQDYCRLEPIDIALIASQTSITGVKINWFNDENCLNPIPGDTLIPPGVNNREVGQFTFYATQTLNGCVSNLFSTSTVTSSSITIRVNSLPATPIVTEPVIKICYNGQLNSTLILSTFTGNSSAISSVTGMGFRWFSDIDGQSPILLSGVSTLVGNLPAQTIVPPVNKTLIGSNFFYVKSRSDIGCLSQSSAALNVQILAIPNPPNLANVANDTLGGGAQCIYSLNNTNIQVSGFSTGAEFRYYANSTITSPISVTSGLIFITGLQPNQPVDLSYFYSQKVDICESARKQIFIKIKPAVSPPNILAPPLFYCTGNEIRNLTVVGSSGNVSWFNNAALLNSIGRGADFKPNINTNVVSNTVLFAYQTVNNCNSNVSTVNIAVRQTPDAPLTTDTAYCTSSPNQIIRPVKAIAEQRNNQYFRWFTSNDTLSQYLGAGTKVLLPNNLVSSSINSSITGTTVVSNKSFFMLQMVNGCPSALSQPSVINVFEKPIKPTSFSPSPLCSGSRLPNLEASGTNLSWYYNSTVTSIQSGQILPLSVLALFVNTVQWTNVNAQPKTEYLYVSQTTNKSLVTPRFQFVGCQSDFKIDTVKIFPIPPVPTIINNNKICEGQQFNLITAIGVNTNASINWYRDNAESNFVSSNKILNPNNLGLLLNQDVNLYTSQVFNGCKSPTLLVPLKVFLKPIVRINSNLLDKYCVDDAIIDIVVSPTISGVSSLAGVYGGRFANVNLNLGFQKIDNRLARLNPSFYTTATNGIIKYIYENADGCVDSVSVNIAINPKPVITFSGLLDTYCENSEISNLVEINPTNSNGVFSGEGISNNSFNPQNASLGLKTITYNYTNPLTGCKQSVQKTTRVYPKPKALFTTSSLCVNTNAEFRDVSTIDNANNITGLGNSNIEKHYWVFNNVLTANTAFVNDFLRREGNYNVKLTVETNYGCSGNIDSTLRLGSIPKADFIATGICFGNTTKLLNRSSVLSGNIEKYQWYVDDILQSNVDVESIDLNLSQIKQYNIKLNIETDKGCKDDTIKKINILPTILANRFPYFQSFAVNDGWFAEGENSDWLLGEVNNTNLKSVNPVWYTQIGNNNSYRRAQSSWVNSPCFDLSNIDRPMLVFNYSSYMYRDDGVVLQASLDGGNSWENVGNINSGINWFNKSNIFANPGKQQNFKNGWSIFSEQSNEWIEARHSLQKYKGRNEVRFRLALGSTPNSILSNDVNKYDGFAFDNIWIGNRTKSTVIEQFINISNDETVILNLNDNINTRQGDVIALKYHTNFPESDFINAFNPFDISSRVLFYGIKNTPRTIFDGNVRNDLTDLFEPSIIDIKSLETPKFKISLSKTISGTDMNINVKLKADTTVSDSAYIVQVAIVERFYTENGKSYQSVVRKLLPDASGTYVSQNWDKNTPPLDINLNWTLDSRLSNDSLEVVAFIQNLETKNILQAASTGARFDYTSINNTNNLNSNLFFNVYPNPVSGILNISSNPDLEFNNVEIFDLLGNKSLSQNLELGKSLNKINVSMLNNGVYILKAHSNKIDFKKAFKIIISK